MVLLTHLGNFGYRIDCTRERINIGYGYGSTASTGLVANLDTALLLPPELTKIDDKYPTGFQVTVMPRLLKRPENGNRSRGISSRVLRRERDHYMADELILHVNGSTKREAAYAVIWSIPYAGNFQDCGRFFNFCAVIGESKVESVERAIKNEPFMVRNTGEDLDKKNEFSKSFSAAFDMLGSIADYRNSRKLPHRIYARDQQSK